MCVYMCMRACVHRHMYVYHMCMWWSDDHLRHQSSPSSLSEEDSPVLPCMCQARWGSVHGLSSLCPPHMTARVWRLQMHTTASSFAWVLGLKLACQVLYPSRHLSSPPCFPEQWTSVSCHWLWCSLWVLFTGLVLTLTPSTRNLLTMNKCGGTHL